MFVLVGQVLNARGAVRPDDVGADRQQRDLGRACSAAYLVDLRPRGPARRTTGVRTGSWSAATPAARSCCSGSARRSASSVQLLVLLPYLQAAGFRYRPRFDFRGTGLGHTLRLGIWTVLFVVVNQIAYTVVVRIASSGTADAVRPAAAATGTGTGYTIYSNAFLLVMVPHAIATVSLATAMLPRLSSYAADADLRGVAPHRRVDAAHGVRADHPVRAAAAGDRARPRQRRSAATAPAGRACRAFAPSLALFAPGLVFFTTHYLMLRGFYALERTRTVFWVQCVIAATNIVLAVRADQPTSRPPDTAPGPGDRLRRRLPGRRGRAPTPCCARCSAGWRRRVLVRFLVRLLLAAGVAAAVGLGWSEGRAGRGVADRRRQGAGRWSCWPSPAWSTSWCFLAAGPAAADHRGDRASWACVTGRLRALTAAPVPW